MISNNPDLNQFYQIDTESLFNSTIIQNDTTRVLTPMPKHVAFETTTRPPVSLIANPDTCKYENCDCDKPCENSSRQILELTSIKFYEKELKGLSDVEISAKISNSFKNHIKKSCVLRMLAAETLILTSDARNPSLTISHLLDKKPSDRTSTNYIMLDELKDKRIEIYGDDPIFQFEQYDITSRGITTQEFDLDDCSLTLQLCTRFGWYLQMNGFSNTHEITSDIFHMTDKENVNPENFRLTFDEENINFRVFDI